MRTAAVRTAAARTAVAGNSVLAAFSEPAARADLRLQLTSPEAPGSVLAAGREPAHQAGARPYPLRPPSRQAEAEQQEHDRYFDVGRIGGDAARGFVAGLVLAHLSAYENCLDMGVTLLDGPQWELLFGGLRALLQLAGDDAAASAAAGAGCRALPARPSPAGWRDGYDPAGRWLIGHQLFFTLIQGAIVGLNCFASAVADQVLAEAEEGLALSAAFLRSSAAAMRLASDFAPVDYDRTVRPAMAPPKVRQGFSGLQTRDHAYLVRLFGAVKPALAALVGRVRAHEEFVESVVSAYAAHEFICARFRGDVLPSLRMAAVTRGKTERRGTEVIREMMRARLALVDPARTVE